MKEKQQDLIAVTSNLISASAGTGKTYQLASRFVALLALGYKAEEMIALTFTRKAAGEFRNRILKALSDGALDLNADGTPRCPDAEGRLTGRNAITARVWETWSGLVIRDGKPAPAGNSVALCPDSACVVELAAKAGLTPEELYAQDDELFARLKLPRLTADTYRNLLADVVNAMSRLALSTLDSFFNRIVRGNSLTIGIRNIVPLEPEDTELERQAVLRDLLAQISTATQDGHNFLQQFDKLTCGEGKNMMNYLQEQIKSHLTLFRNVSNTEAWGNAEAFGLTVEESADTIAPEQWIAYENELNALVLGVEETGSRLAKKAASAASALIKNLKKGDYEFLHKHTSPHNANAGSAVNKFCEATLSTEEEHALADAMNRILREVRAAHLQAAIHRTHGLFYVLNRYATAYLNHMRRTGRVGFDDIAMFAYHLMKDNGSDSRDYAANRITYNLDATYKHWMLDEFQDTSEMQFATLEPVLNEIAQGERHARTGASERSIFVVGDDKQSIYGFRTGDTEVFRKLQTETPWKETLHRSGLEKSFRSSPELMGENGFVNNMFLALDAVEREIVNADVVDYGCDDRLTFNDRLGKVFTQHRSATNKTGYVRISAVPAEENSSDTRLAFYDNIADLLKDELTDKNCAPLNGMSIAILTRNNNEAAELEERLGEKLPKLPVLRLGDDKVAATSQLGELLLSFFLWLQHPDDEYRASLVKASPMGALFRSPLEEVPLSRYEYRQKMFRLTHEYWRHRLELQGYAAVVGDLLSCFPTTPQDLRHGRTAQIWLTEAHAFDCTGGTMDEWISRIGKAGSAAAASSRYVQIMTMHKSKGLEFDAVILPYIAESAEDELDDLGYFALRDPQGDVEALLLNPGGAKKRDAWKEVFDPLCAVKKQQSRKEAYNLLYVAATRAKHANYIFCNGSELGERKKKNPGQIIWKGSARSTSGLLRRMLMHAPFKDKVTVTPAPEAIPQAVTLWESGDSRWFEDVRFVRENNPSESPAPPPELPAVSRHRRRHISPSSLAAEEDKEQSTDRTAPQSLLNSTCNAGTHFGTAVHACFEQITTLSDPLPAWLSAPTAPEQEVVAAALQQPDVRELFTLRPNQEVCNEQPIEAITARNEWMSGTIDRLILTLGTDGSVIGAHIIDYKTNKLVPDEQEPDVFKVLMKKYTAQMSAYKLLVSQAFHLPEHCVSVSLISCPADYLTHPARVLTY